MRAMAWRPLSAGERGLAHEMFGPGLDAARVRLLALPVWPRAFVAGPRLILWPARHALADFAGAPLPVQASFVHELTHVWQAQRGVMLALAKLRAGDAAQAYAYDLADGRAFAELNIEQQASVVEHAFLASRGAATPFARHLYAQAASAWREV